MKQRIAIDMDGVIADLYTPWLKKYNDEFNDSMTVDMITLWNWHSLTKDVEGEKLYTYLDDPFMFENLNVIANSQQVIEELSQHFDIYITTAAFNPNNVPAKSKWLQKHFPFINSKNYVFVRNKGVINANFMIDDHSSNFDGFCGEGVLFTQPHNKSETNFVRVNNWLEVREWFLG